MERKMHVTIVDDVKDNLQSYNDLLSPTFNLELIQNPIDLLGFLSKTQTDLILLDLHMPTINGFFFTKNLKLPTQNYPLFFLVEILLKNLLLEDLISEQMILL